MKAGHFHIITIFHCHYQHSTKGDSISMLLSLHSPWLADELIGYLATPHHTTPVLTKSPVRAEGHVYTLYMALYGYVHTVYFTMSGYGTEEGP